MEVHQLFVKQLFTSFCDRGARAAHLMRIHFCLTSLGIRFHKHMQVITVLSYNRQAIWDRLTHTHLTPSRELTTQFLLAARAERTLQKMWTVFMYPHLSVFGKCPDFGEKFTAAVCLCDCVALLFTKPQRVEDLRKGCHRSPCDIRFRTDVLSYKHTSSNVHTHMLVSFVLRRRTRGRSQTKKKKGPTRRRIQDTPYLRELQLLSGPCLLGKSTEFLQKC